MQKNFSGKSKPLSQDSAEILIAEYNYIARTADQANEDRARVSSFYLIAVGSIVAALFSTKILSEMFDVNTVNIIFSVLFFLLTLLGTTTILQLTRLRVAWFESVLAMNHIKEFVIAKDEELAGAFKWRTKTLPSFYKVNSVSFLQTVEVAFISALTFGAGVFFLQKSIRYDCAPCNLAFTILCGILAFFFQIWNYKRQLTLDHKRLQKELEGDNAS
jgi:amino acid permease